MTASPGRLSGPETGSYDYVIIGGGIAGLSIAYHLTATGDDRVLLVEQNTLGSGATGYSSGGVRQQFSTADEIQLSVRALEFWKQAEVTFGAPCAFEETGYLFVTADEGSMSRLGGAAELQRSLGAGEVEVLDRRGVARIAPWMNSDRLVGGTWSPHDGRIVPSDGVNALAMSARAGGARIRQGMKVETVEQSIDGYRIQGPDLAVEAATLVVAAGLGTTRILQSLGHTVVVRPWTIHYAFTAPALTQHHIPNTIDLDCGMSVKREGPGLKLGILDEASSATSHADEMLEEFFHAAEVRAPGLLDVEIIGTMTADADLSVDGHPYAGQLAKGLWVLAGFGGHGTMHGPVLAEDLVGAMRSSDESPLAAFDPKRVFAAETQEWLVASRKS